MDVYSTYHTRKVSRYGVIPGPYFPAFSQNAEKYGPEITPHLDTFHAEIFYFILLTLLDTLLGTL